MKVSILMLCSIVKSHSLTLVSDVQHMLLNFD